MSLVESTRPLEFDRITLDHARALESKPVVVSFIVGEPCDRTLGFTVVGVGEAPDEVSRVALVAGNRLGEIEVGRRIRVVGTLRVLRHPQSFKSAGFSAVGYPLVILVIWGGISFAVP